MDKGDSVNKLLDEKIIVVMYPGACGEYPIQLGNHTASSIICPYSIQWNLI